MWYSFQKHCPHTSPHQRLRQIWKAIVHWSRSWASESNLWNIRVERKFHPVLHQKTGLDAEGSLRDCWCVPKDSLAQISSFGVFPLTCTVMWFVGAELLLIFHNDEAENTFVTFLTFHPNGKSQRIERHRSANNRWHWHHQRSARARWNTSTRLQ